MGTLHRYLLRQTAATLGLTVTVCTAILLLGSVLKDLLNLLATGNVSLSQLVFAIGLLIPFVFAFALPIGMLTAALLVFGRLGADQEITAARAGGLSVLWLAAPVLFLSLAMCGVCAWFNCEISPRCRIAFLDLQRRTVDLALRPGGALQAVEGQYFERGPYTIYAGKVRDGKMEDLLVFQLSNGHRLLDARAASGEIIQGTNGQSAELVLREVQGLKILEGANDHALRPFYYAEVRTNYPTDPNATRAKPKYSDMTLRQLMIERREIRGRGGEVGPVVLQLHRQVAFSFACFGFTLVGIPLGLRGHRRETNLGIGLALLLMLVYYGFVILGQALATKPHWHPHLIFWVPNFLFQGLGAWMLWRADRVGR